MPEPLDLDKSPEAADWIKRGTWDIPASNLDELRAYLDARRIRVEHFKRLPVYTSNLVRHPWLRDLR